MEGTSRGTGALGRRRRREEKTLAAMFRIFCRDRHGARGSLCDECRSLLDYARERLSRCPFGEEKPACIACPIHCYDRRRREAVKEVMRDAGPRMLRRHPILAILHLMDGRRPAPPIPRRDGPSSAGARAADGG